VEQKERYPLVVEVRNHQLGSLLLRKCKFRNDTRAASHYPAAEHGSSCGFESRLNVGSGCARRKVPSYHNKWARGALNRQVVSWCPSVFGGPDIRLAVSCSDGIPDLF
jgi:hypothetical protein